MVIASHRAEQQARVAGGPGQRARVVEAERVRIDPAEAHAAVGRLEADDPAARGRATDRATGVGTGRAWAQERRHGRAGSAARASGRAVESPRVARWPVPRIVGRRARGELVSVALADQDRAGIPQPANRLGILRRDVVAEERGAMSGPHAIGVEDVLEANRNAVERAAPTAGRELGFRPARPRARLGGHDGHESVQHRIESLDAREMRLGHLHRRHRPRAHQTGELGDREEAQVVVHVLVTARSRLAGACSRSA